MALYVKVPPDKAVVILDKKGNIKRVSAGGGRYLNPFTERYRFLPMDVRTLDLNPKNVVTTLEDINVELNLYCVVQIKISYHRDCLFAAARSLLENNDEEIDKVINDIALKVIEGQVRGLSRNMNPARIYSERDTFSKKVCEKSNIVLLRHGIEARSFILKMVDDEHGYWEDMVWGRSDLFLERMRNRYKVNDDGSRMYTRPTRESYEDAKDFTCPFCLFVVPVDIMLCPECNMDLTSLQNHVKEMKRVNKAERILEEIREAFGSVCPNCELELAEDTMCCPRCKTDLAAFLSNS